MRVRSMRLRAVLLATAVVALGAGMTVPAGAAESDPVPLLGTDGDALPPLDAETGKPLESAVMVSPNGYSTFDNLVDNAYSYTVRIIASTRAEQYRSVIQSVATELRQAGVADLTVASGQLTAATNAVPPAHEIYFYTPPASGCEGRIVAGCGGPFYAWRATGNDVIAVSGRASILPIVDGYSAMNKRHVVAHELGHALGLEHYSSTYQGVNQVMHPSSYDSSIFQTGDRNGLRQLSRDIVPVGTVDSVTIPSTGRVRVVGWAFDPDLLGAPKARITIDGATATDVTLNVLRSDVNSKHSLPRTANRGFDVTTTMSAGAHVVCVTVANYPRASYKQVGACTSVTKAGVTSSSRIAGVDRYATAAAVARAAYPDQAPVVVVATGEQFPDALSAGPVAAQLGGPLLLTKPGSLPTVTRDELARLSPKRIVVAGGPGAVSEAVVADLHRLTPTVERVSGIDRYETANQLAGYAFTSASTVYVASGVTFADALAAGAAAANDGAPLLLVSTVPSAVDASVGALTGTLGATTVRVAGGATVISNTTLETLRTAVPKTVRLSGVDRYQTAVAVNQASFTGPASTVLIVNALNFPDGLVAAPLAALKDAPVYLSNGNCVPRSVLTEMNRLNTANATLVGGTGTLTDAVARVTTC